MAHSEFVRRHVGLTDHQIGSMLSELDLHSLDELVERVIPDSILHRGGLALAQGLSETDALAEIQQYASRNQRFKSLLGQGYYGTYMPSVLQRNVLENPSWYTAYTPYQPEISQGRLELLFNFQTLITELTALSMANASLLDEGTAAAEAMTLAHRVLRGRRGLMLVADNCHPQTIDVLRTRSKPLNIIVRVLAVESIPSELENSAKEVFGVLLQYPGTLGEVAEPSTVVAAIKNSPALLIVASDLLALTLLAPPGEWGADIVVGSSQRFGIPMGFGGPHAAFMATSDKYKRNLPGRLIGQSLTALGKPAYRLALQTREQHIRREKATSNICTAQALLAILATLYACYHGPQGLRVIARRVRHLSDMLAATLEHHGLTILNDNWFDTLQVQVDDADAMLSRALVLGYNLRKVDANSVSMSLDETTTTQDLVGIVNSFVDKTLVLADLIQPTERDPENDRAFTFMSQACFHDFQTETEMMRYLRRLADMDIALDRSMIPLGSCTMKLNAAAEMTPISWPNFSDMHPFAPAAQSQGYRELIADLESMLCACTGYDAVSLQPNAGSQGEYAGLLAIKRYHVSCGETERKICLIPSSAHGTNPASAHMAGLTVQVVACDTAGNVDIDDLQRKLDANPGKVAAIMITYPSTHGVFETAVRDVCDRTHAAGAQVYIDGANLNAMVGTAQPGKFGGDVSHLNLHKTFCIPHGGGGPGIGPIGVAKHLQPFLPGHREMGDATGVVCSAPWGSAMILPITWMYIRMMGSSGLLHATRVAILNANYIAHKLAPCYPILYRGENGWVAHECILDTRVLKDEAGITVDDIAKRLMDYGFHAPTMSFPVPGTLMVEPTESESLQEIDRFCDAMLAIHAEAMRVKSQEWPVDDNPLINAPHTAEMLTLEPWNHPYSRSIAVYPMGENTIQAKYWPPVSRIDNVFGDKHLICSCPPLSSYQIPDEDTAQHVA